MLEYSKSYGAARDMRRRREDGNELAMTTPQLTALVISAALLVPGCAVREEGPKEFSIQTITISNPVPKVEDRRRTGSSASSR